MEKTLMPASPSLLSTTLSTSVSDTMLAHSPAPPPKVEFPKGVLTPSQRSLSCDLPLRTVTPERVTARGLP